MPPTCLTTSLPISTLKWQKTATLGREGDAKNRRGCVDLLNQVKCGSPEPQRSDPCPRHSLKEPVDMKPCCLHTSYHSNYSANNIFSIYYQFILCDRISGVNFPFLFLKPSFKSGFHYLTLGSRFLHWSLRLNSSHSHLLCTNFTEKKSSLGYFWPSYKTGPAIKSMIAKIWNMKLVVLLFIY